MLPDPLPPAKVPPLEYPPPAELAQYLPADGDVGACVAATREGRRCRRVPRPGQILCGGHLGAVATVTLWIDWRPDDHNIETGCPACGSNPREAPFRHGPGIWMEGHCEQPLCIPCEARMAPWAAAALATWDQVTGNLPLEERYALWGTLAQAWHWPLALEQRQRHGAGFQCTHDQGEAHQ